MNFAFSEEQDELVRAAEELGIELAPVSVRVMPEQPSVQEAEEGTDKLDADGLFSVPADEQTVDLDAALAGTTTDTASAGDDPFADLGEVTIKDLTTPTDDEAESDE